MLLSTKGHALFLKEHNLVPELTPHVVPRSRRGICNFTDAFCRDQPQHLSYGVIFPGGTMTFYKQVEGPRQQSRDSHDIYDQRILFLADQSLSSQRFEYPAKESRRTKE